MSAQYDQYLKEHIQNVQRGYDWMGSHFPNLIREGNIVSMNINDLPLSVVISQHDGSKYMRNEYDAYDDYFYGNNKSYSVMRNFDKAWLYHQHNNPHHWQYWVLIKDDKENQIQAIDIPLNYIIEMICDWWSFSWKSGNLYEIFDWYDQNKDGMILSDATRTTVEKILADMRGELDSWRLGGIKKNSGRYPWGQQ